MEKEYKKNWGMDGVIKQIKKRREKNGNKDRENEN
jgi:hypothetical protein